MEKKTGMGDRVKEAETAHNGKWGFMILMR